MIPLAFLVVGVSIVGYGLVSRRLEGTSLTGPMVFALVGLLVGVGTSATEADGALELLDLAAELTLVIVLFTDASRIQGARLRSEYIIPTRLLAIGLPLCIVLGAVAALPVFPGMSLAAAGVLSVLLAPTDAALGQSVVEDEAVPVRIRQSINVESGLNDGIALPILLSALFWANGRLDRMALTDFGATAALQLILGPLVGVAVGWLAAMALDRSEAQGWLAPTFERIASVGIALAAFGLAEQTGGNGFIAAFCAGLAVGNTSESCRGRLQEFAGAQGELLMAATFIMFGALMLPELAQLSSWRPLVYAMLSLLVIRPVAVWISLLGLGLNARTVLFMGWFGPRGLATVLYALLMMKQGDFGHADLVSLTATLAVGLSILLHGFSAAPLARAYGAFIRGRERPELPELESVGHKPLRHERPGSSRSSR